MALSDCEPTLAGFTDWIRTIMGVPVGELPDASPYLVMSFRVALHTVSLDLRCLDPYIYTLAVYNLGGDRLVNWTQDISPSTYWADIRDKMNIIGFQGGIVAAAYDQGTGTTLQVVEGLKNLTVGQLQNLKTPWGQQYIAWAQALGPNIWGLT